MTTCPPLMRYYGGKYRLGDEIARLMPPHRIYVEPYAGSGGVLFARQPSYAEVLNDLAGDVVNLYRVLRDPERAAELQRLLELTPYARAEFEAAWEAADDPIEQARRLLIRSQMSFFSAGASCGNSRRSGFRVGVDRRGTHPALDWARYPARIPALTQRLAGVVVEQRDALEAIPALDGPETLYYVDPPYLPETRRDPTWRRNYRYDLTDADHVRLAEVLRACSGYVVLSGYRSQLYEDLYPDWTLITLRGQAATSAGSEITEECVWLSPRTEADRPRLEQMTLELGEETDHD